jgi:hypothetical protein
MLAMCACATLFFHLSNIKVRSGVALKSEFEAGYYEMNCVKG